jgi:hypothetical protein
LKFLKKSRGRRLAAWIPVLRSRGRKCTIKRALLQVARRIYSTERKDFRLAGFAAISWAPLEEGYNKKRRASLRAAL